MEEMPDMAYKGAENGPKWSLFGHLGDGLKIMVSHLTCGIEFGIMLILHVPLLVPHHLAEASRLNLDFPDPSELTEIPDKLRWYRYRKALLQREVADYAGIARRTYNHYEDGTKEYYPVDKLMKIAELLEVELTELMDEYNLFLYHNQGKQIRQMRLSQNKSVAEYEKELGIREGQLWRWENNQKMVSKATWKKYFRERK